MVFCEAYHKKLPMVYLVREYAKCPFRASFVQKNSKVNEPAQAAKVQLKVHKVVKVLHQAKVSKSRHEPANIGKRMREKIDGFGNIVNLGNFSLTASGKPLIMVLY